MRRLCLAIALVGAGVATASAGSVLPFPRYDIAKACRAQADYAFAATLGQTDTDKEIALCADLERENMASAQTFWTRVSQKEADECLILAEGRYGRLTRCLETSRSVRRAR